MLKVYILYFKIFIDPGLLKIRHSPRLVAVVIKILISFVLNKKTLFRLLAGLVSLKVQKPRHLGEVDSCTGCLNSLLPRQQQKLTYFFS